MRVFLVCVVLAILIFAAAIFTSIGRAPFEFLQAYENQTLLSLKAWGIGLGIIVLAALFCRGTKKRRGIELTVAAETIVVWGIFGLLANIGAGTLTAFPDLLGKGATPDIEKINIGETIPPIVARFGEGLLAAAFAPLVAVILRLIDSGNRRRTAEDGAIAEPAMTGTLARFEDMLKAAGKSVDASSKAFAAAADRLAEAAKDLESGLTGKGKAIGDSLKATVSSLNTLNTALTTVRESSKAAGDNVNTLGHQARDAAPPLRKFAEAAGLLSAAAKQLEELAGSGARISGELTAAQDSLKAMNGSLADMRMNTSAAGESINALGNESQNAVASLRSMQNAVHDVTNFVRGD